VHFPPSTNFFLYICKMNVLLIEKLLQLAIGTALKAGDAIMEIYHSNEFDIEAKGDKSPLTKADLAAHRIIINELSKADIPVLSEEGSEIPYSKRKNWDVLWIIDPLDGTKEFIARNDEFTVNIALIKDGKPILGVVYAPAISEMYWGTEKEGSFRLRLNSNERGKDFFLNQQKLPLKFAMDKPFTVVASRSHMNSETTKLVEQYKEKYPELIHKSFGSSLKLCNVAAGIADVYPRIAPTMEWDTAAAHAVCKFAGCKVVSYPDGKELTYNKDNLLNSYFLVERVINDY